MQLIEAAAIAEEIRATLAPWCARCEIAGSVRRKKAEVGDIEIVAILRTRDLPALVRVVDRWPAVKGTITGRYTQRRHPSGMRLDLFLATPENWGAILLIRTGDSAFSKYVVGTALPRHGYRQEGGYVRQDGVVVPVREEIEMFRLSGLTYIDPEKRIGVPA